MAESKDSLRQACENFAEDLVLYYYGERREPESRRVEEHLRVCASCERFLQDLREFLPLTAEPDDHSEAFWKRYYEEMQEKLAAVQDRQPWWGEFFSLSYRWSVPAFGTAVVLTLALALTLGKGVWHFKSLSLLEEPPPEIQAGANIDFFENMDLLESMELLEAMDEKRVGPRAAHQL
jgi:hypothetical protein